MFIRAYNKRIYIQKKKIHETWKTVKYSKKKSPRVSTGPRINIHKKHGKTIKWVLSMFPCFLCSASPRFLFRLTIECTREYKKLELIWSKSGCDKKIIEWMAMKISEKRKIKSTSQCALTLWTIWSAWPSGSKWVKKNAQTILRRKTCRETPHYPGQ